MNVALYCQPLLALRFLDMDQLVEAGVLAERDKNGWQAFRADPTGFLVEHRHDRAGQLLWQLIRGTL